MDSDKTLLLQFQAGSHPALEELFARYRDGIYGFFRRRLKNTNRAEDLTQETFLAIIHGIVRYEPRASVRTYLYGIAFRVLFAELRKQDNSGSVMANEKQLTNDAPDVVLWVREALQKLDNNDREILMLREYEQLTYDEIAVVLRLPLNTVRSRLFRARMSLRDYLEPEKRQDVTDRGETCR